MSKNSRHINEINQEEIDSVNQILQDEYYYSHANPLKTSDAIMYQCFNKSHAIYSGFGVIAVYKYLNSIGIDIYKQ